MTEMISIVRVDDFIARSCPFTTWFGIKSISRLQNHFHFSSYIHTDIYFTLFAHRARQIVIIIKIKERDRILVLATQDRVKFQSFTRLRLR